MDHLKDCELSRAESPYAEYEKIMSSELQVIRLARHMTCTVLTASRYPYILLDSPKEECVDLRVVLRIHVIRFVRVGIERQTLSSAAV